MESFEQYEKRQRAAWLAIRRADYTRYSELINAWTLFLEGEVERLNPAPKNKQKVIVFSSHNVDEGETERLNPAPKNKQEVIAFSSHNVD